MRKTRLGLHLVIPALLAIAAQIAPVAMVPAQAQGASGDLRCRIAGGLGLDLGAQRGLTCVYYRKDGTTEFYTGSASRVGIDIGATNAVRVAYHVAGVDPTMPAALEGAFGGPGVGVTVGAGIGAAVLVGGRTGSASLIPIGNTYLTGIDISAGLSVFTLRYAGMETLRDRNRGY